MTCEPEKVTAFVDAALDVQETVRIELHVQACPECHEQADFERGLRRRLAALRSPVPGDLLELRVRRAVHPPRGGRVVRWAAAAAAALLVAVWAHGAPAFVATQLAWDHGHCFGKPTLPAKVWTADPDYMAAWLLKEGTLSPSLPDHAGGLEMVGARYCALGDRRVAHIYYTGGDQRLSVYVVPGWVRLDRPSQMTRGDKTVRLLRAGDATVGLVSERPEAVEAFQRALTITVAEELERLAAGPN